MTSRKIIAVFDTSEEAQTARNKLIDMSIPGDRVTITDQSSSGERTLRTPNARGSFWAHVKEMFMPDHDRHTYEESVRRGGYMLIATVDDDVADEAIACLERAGAVDLNDREAKWRSEGWQPATDRETSATERIERDTAARDTQPYDVAEDRKPDTTRDVTTEARAASTAGLEAGSESAKIPVVEERLLIGKREVNRGSVRVRSYIVEEPVHEEVRLREEHVNVERRPVNEPVRPVVKGSPEDLLQEKTIEVSETAEQAVVGKEARITEQVVVSKDTDERVESVDDTVRRTKVEIEDGRQPGSGSGRKAKSERPTRRTPP